MEVKIDPEFRDVLPRKQSDYENLEKEVLRDGCFTDPFITWNGYLIDGHTRHAIMQAHPEVDLKPYEKKMDDKFADRYAVIVWIASHQENRRNLNEFELAEVHKKAYDAQKKTQGGNRGNQYTKVAKFESELSQTEDEPRSHAGTTATVLAKEFGVESPSKFMHSVRTANAMEEGEKVVPGFKEGLKNGTIKASKDRVEKILSVKDEDDRKEYVQTIVNGEKAKKFENTKEVRDRFAKIRDVARRMGQGHSANTFDDILTLLNAASDDFIWKIRRTIEGEKDALKKDDRWPDALEGYFDSIIHDIEELKGEITK